MMVVAISMRAAKKLAEMLVNFCSGAYARVLVEAAGQ